MKIKVLVLVMIVLFGCDSSSSTKDTKVIVWPNGIKKSESIIENNRIITQKGWDENGILKYEFANIIEDTIMTYDSIEGYYIEHINVSRYEKRYFVNGIIKIEGEIIDSKPNGEWLFYNEKGLITKKEIYLDGNLVRIIE